MHHARYDQIAEWYDATVRSGSLVGDVVLGALFDLIGEVANTTLCDLACGQGRIARVLAQRGAQVVGIDLSVALLNIAQRDEHANPLGITYFVDDAEQLAQLPDASFDGVVCHLALMDMSDLAAVGRAVWRVLRPDAWFIVSITHPCFEAPHAQWIDQADGTTSRAITHYFQEGEWFSTNTQGVRGRVGAHHRMISTYLNTFTRTGLQLDQVVEPRVTGELARRTPASTIVPPFLLMRWRKP